MTKKWYVVWVGRSTGVFDNWPETQSYVNGFAGARYKSFKYKALAIHAFIDGWEKHVKCPPKQKEIESWT